MPSPTAPARRRGGRPKRIGARLGTPTDLARTASWRRYTVYRYRRQVPVDLAETCCLWYDTYRSRTVRVVLVRDVGSTAKAGYDLALITTDLHSPAAEILARYAARWSIEVAFEDARQHTGVGEARNRTLLAVERTVPFGLITQSIVVVWYAQYGHSPNIVDDRRARAPVVAHQDPPVLPRHARQAPAGPHRRPVSCEYDPTTDPRRNPRAPAGLGRSRRVEPHKSESRVMRAAP